MSLSWPTVPQVLKGMVDCSELLAAGGCMSGTNSSKEKLDIVRKQLDSSGFKTQSYMGHVEKAVNSLWLSWTQDDHLRTLCVWVCALVRWIGHGTWGFHRCSHLTAFLLSAMTAVRCLQVTWQVAKNSKSTMQELSWFAFESSSSSQN